MRNAVSLRFNFNRKSLVDADDRATILPPHKKHERGGGRTVELDSNGFFWSVPVMADART